MTAKLTFLRSAAILTVALTLPRLAAAQKFELASTKELTENARVSIVGFSADGKQLLYTNGPDLYLLEVATGGMRRLFNVSVAGFGMRLSPDGQSIYFGRRENKRLLLFRMPLAGGPAVKVLDDIESPAFSPDGKKIAFYRRDYAYDKTTGLQRMASQTLMTANVDGSGQRKIADFDVRWFSWMMWWAPEGDRLAFLRSEPGGSKTAKLMAVSLRAGEITELAPWMDYLTALTWPPGAGGLYAMEGRNLENSPVRLMYCPLPGGQWTQVAENLPANAWSTVFHATSDGLILATTRGHTAETFWDGLLGLFLWKQASAWDHRSELVIIRLRKKQD